MGLGAKFHKADLHIHTPYSNCYPCKTDKPEDIVSIAKKQGLDVIAITDHNQFKAIGDIKTLAEKNGIVVFPGLELTTENCHIVALFDTCIDIHTLDDVLTECGISKGSARGDGNYTGHSALIVLDAIRKYKGIGIAVHCDAPKGKSSLFQVRSDLQNKILDHDCLYALEICDRANSSKYFTNNKNAEKKPIIQSSDAHELGEIGTRYTYFKMDSPTLDGLKLAFLEHATRVKPMDGIINTKFPRIQDMNISKGFLSGNNIEFSPYLTCLIGGTGTGKSTIVECMRYCFGNLSTEKEIRDDTFGKLKKLIGPGGVITISYRTEYDELAIIKREVVDDPEGDPSFPLITDTEGNEITLLTTPTFYSQGEIALIARRPTLQMNLVDAGLDLSEEAEAEKRLLKEIGKLSNSLVGNIERMQEHQEAVDDPDTGKAATTKRIKELKKILKDKIFKEFPRWEKEKRFLDTPTRVFKNLEAAVSRYKEEFKTLSSGLQSIDEGSPNYSSLRSINSFKITLDTKADSAFDSLMTNIAALEKRFTKTKLNWEADFVIKQAEYTKLLEGIKESLIQEAQSKLRHLERKLDQLSEYESNIASLSKAIEKDLLERTNRVSELQKVRAKRYFKRGRLAKGWNKQLKRTKVVIKQAADTSLFLKKLDTILSGSGIYKNDKAAIVNKFSPSELFTVAWTENHKTLCTLCGFNEEKATRIINLMKDNLSILLTVDIVDVPDVPDICFEKTPGNVSSLEQLSTGEKSIALLSIAMMEGNCPIVIDQPEDSLDTKYIYEEIVSKLKRQKEQRQFICSSHNANIVVSADSDLTHVLDATADQGIIESSGGIEDPKTNRLMLTHLEGGPKAFRLRIKKYVLPAE